MKGAGLLSGLSQACELAGRGREHPCRHSYLPSSGIHGYGMGNFTT
jgi:hypothetical protein